MALQFGELYKALVEGGASPEKAAAAAEEVATHQRNQRRRQMINTLHPFVMCLIFALFCALSLGLNF